MAWLQFLFVVEFDSGESLHNDYYMIHITEAAAKQLHVLVEEKSLPPTDGLRLAVEKGGCAGLQYAMTLATPQAGDHIAEAFGARVLVDPESLAYLDGSTLDYEDGLSGAGFRIHNPKATRSCGCGTSFEPAA